MENSENLTGKKSVHVPFDKRALEKVDAAADKLGLTRCAYIRASTLRAAIE